MLFELSVGDVLVMCATCVAVFLEIKVFEGLAFDLEFGFIRESCVIDRITFFAFETYELCWTFFLGCHIYKFL